MIISIDALDGEIVKKKYDYVSRGEKIISGTIMNKTREVKKIKARGKVYGEVWYKVSVEIPRKYKEEIYTGNSKKVLSILFLKHDYSLELKHYKNYSFNNITLFKNNILPIKLAILTKREVKYKENIYNINNIDKTAIKLAKEKLKNKSIIVSKILKKRYNRNTIEVFIFFKVKEDITATRKITDLELKEEVKEDE